LALAQSLHLHPAEGFDGEGPSFLEQSVSLVRRLLMR
jgi:hypothetical protein